MEVHGYFLCHTMFLGGELKEATGAICLVLAALSTAFLEWLKCNTALREEILDWQGALAWCSCDQKLCSLLPILSQTSLKTAFHPTRRRLGWQHSLSPLLLAEMKPLLPRGFTSQLGVSGVTSPGASSGAQVTGEQ